MSVTSTWSKATCNAFKIYTLSVQYVCFLGMEPVTLVYQVRHVCLLKMCVTVCLSMKYSAATGPPIGPNCEHCGQRFQVWIMDIFICILFILLEYISLWCVLTCVYLRNLIPSSVFLVGWSIVGGASTWPFLCSESSGCCLRESRPFWNIKAYRGDTEHGDRGQSFIWIWLFE